MGIHNSPQGCPCEPFLILKKRSISEFVFRSLEAPIHRAALRRLALSGLWGGLFLSVCFGFQASKFLSGIFLAWLLHGAFGDAINQELSEAFSAKPSPSAQKQYGLQIAEGVVKFSERYHNWTDFDYHRTNDGQRGRDEPPPPGSPLCEP